MKPNRVIDQYGIIHVLDASGWNYVPIEEADPKLPAWQYCLFWTAALSFCLGTLFLAGEGMWMAWSALL